MNGNATVILVVAMTAGQVILDAIGIHMHSLRLSPRESLNRPRRRNSSSGELNSESLRERVVEAGKG